MSFALCFEFMEALIVLLTASCSEHFALQIVCSHKTHGCGLDSTVEYGAAMFSVAKGKRFAADCDDCCDSVPVQFLERRCQ